MTREDHHTATEADAATWARTNADDTPLDPADGADWTTEPGTWDDFYAACALLRRAS